ncbi:MAG: hypothetical protein GY696_39205 [Gammaproteobacteria bacterium]|nr:hypothetical protein [Gammaproteobacteria bacterium]
MELQKIIFPDATRFFRGQRWVNIGLRTLHLVGLAGLGAGFLYAAADLSWQLYYKITLYSGLGLMLIAIWNHGVWLLQLRGQAILFKLLLLLLMPLFPGWEKTILLLIILISGVISHAPGKVRYYSLWHRRHLE